MWAGKRASGVSGPCVATQVVCGQKRPKKPMHSVAFVTTHVFYLAYDAFRSVRFVEFRSFVLINATRQRVCEGFAKLNCFRYRPLTPSPIYGPLKIDLRKGTKV